MKARRLDIASPARNIYGPEGLALFPLKLRKNSLRPLYSFLVILRDYTPNSTLLIEDNEMI